MRSAERECGNRKGNSYDIGSKSEIQRKIREVQCQQKQEERVFGEEQVVTEFATVTIVFRKKNLSMNLFYNIYITYNYIYYYA